MADEVGRDEGGSGHAVAAESPRRRTHWKRRITLIFVVLTLLAAGVVLPPLVNIGRYQGQVTALMSRSLGRPVHLSDVELRLLPTPGFVLHDVSVSEDPSFGAEPILSARTVVASVRLFSLWRGKLEVSRISVDEASLNLVRTEQGRWNLESVLMGAAQHGSGSSSAGGVSAGTGKSLRFPYLEATNSRVNLKTGAEKSPFSVVDTDLSLWQDEPGAWRVRLRGQPVRTDMDMSLADTGEVRLEASLHSAAQLREMPLKLQMEWRDAQLGQLSRLVLGSDAGWRGDVTADIEVQGTPDAALTKARLQATGVRRTEFTPETPLDLDANCSFRYQHPVNALHDLDCLTAIGDGRLHLKADLPSSVGSPQAMLEVKQIPLQAGLDLLRTVRSGFAPGIVAGGLVNGSLTYQAVAAPVAVVDKSKKAKGQKVSTSAGSGLTGSLTLDGGVLKDGGLSESVQLPQVVWTPTAQASGDMGLAARLTVPTAAGAAPAVQQAIVVQVGLDRRGYRVGLGGSVGVEKLRGLAYAFGLPPTQAADGFTGGTADLDVAVYGPWIESADVVPVADAKPLAAKGVPAAAPVQMETADSLAGAIQLHHTQWKAGFLAGAVDLPRATLTLAADAVSFDSDFSYPATKSAVKGAALAAVTGSVTVASALNCGATECEPRVSLRFGALDAGVLQTALLGAPAEKTLLSPLLDRMRPKESPKWPQATVEADADSLVLGPVTLRNPSVHMHVRNDEFALDHWEASLLGGEAHGTGTFSWSAGKPDYALTGEWSQVNATALGGLLAARWSGGPVAGSGSVELTGLTEKELADSAAGNFAFDWGGGTISGISAPTGRVESHGAGSERFEGWSGKGTVKGGKVQLGDNVLQVGQRRSSIEGGLAFGGPVRLSERSAKP